MDPVRNRPLLPSFLLPLLGALFVAVGCGQTPSEHAPSTKSALSAPAAWLAPQLDWIMAPHFPSLTGVEGAVAANAQTCTPGQAGQCSLPCGQAGVRVCSGAGVWSACTGMELCNGVDDDCDGQVDNGGVCQLPISALSMGLEPNYHPERMAGKQPTSGDRITGDEDCHGTVETDGVCRIGRHPETPGPVFVTGGGDTTPTLARGWDTQLNACRSRSTGAPIARYQWDVSLPGRSAPVHFETLSCHADFVFPQEGSYPVRVSIVDQNGVTVSVERLVEIRNILVVSLGDSLASGEGNPDVDAVGFPQPSRNPFATQGTPPVWQDRRCHRSLWSWHAQAARDLETENPRTSVTFLALACSGATTSNLLDTSFAGQEDDGKPIHPPQIAQAAEILSQGPDHPVDALFLQIGINDLNFSGFVHDCAEGLNINFTPNSCQDDYPRFTTNSPELKALGGKYTLINQMLRRSYAAGGLGALRHVYIGDYPDITNYASGYGDIVLEGAAPLGLDGKINQVDVQWTHETMMPDLNAVVGQAAAFNGWQYVTGMNSPNEWGSHGYNAAEHWCRHFNESVDVEWREEGVLHPNRLGHEDYRGHLLSAVEKDLPGWTYRPTWGSSNQFEGSAALAWLTGDVNGDGTMDVIHVRDDAGTPQFSVFQSLGTVLSSPIAAGAALPGTDTVTWATGDVDRDGNADVLQVFNSGGYPGFNVYRHTDAGFVRLSSWIDTAGHSAGLAWLTADVNGDHAADLIEPWDDSGQLGLTVYQSDGSTLRPMFSSPDVGQPSAALAFLTGDVNGDGDADLIQVRDDNGTLRLNSYVSDGQAMLPAFSGSMGQPSAALAWLTGDVTGDGRTDVIQVVDNGGLAAANVYASTGSGFEMVEGSGDLGRPSDALKWAVVDVDGDGRADLVQIRNVDNQVVIIVYRSEGESLAYVSSESFTGEGPGALAWLIGDVNGDNRPDILQPWDSAGNVGFVLYRTNDVQLPVRGAPPPPPPPLPAPLCTDIQRFRSTILEGCVEFADGRVECWGNGYQNFGANASFMSVPTPQPQLTGARDWDGSFYHSCVAQADGHVECWGGNLNGTIGDGSNVDRPAGNFAVGIDDAVKVVTLPYSTCALSGDGTVKCWGNNNWGQLGNGTSVSSNSPGPVALPAAALDLEVNSTGIFALLANHTVQYWGSIYNGAYVPDTLLPSELPGLAGATQVSVGMNHVCALMADGTVKCAGDNEYGQLGTGTTTPTTIPQTVFGLGPAVKVMASYEYSCALLQNGTAWCWGFPGHYTLGLTGGVQVANPRPLQVPGINQAVDLMAPGNFSMCVRNRDCSVVCWGNDQPGPAPMPVDLESP